MPIPTLAITDDTRGLPRQPVPLRYAWLVTGLSCANFRYLLTVIQQWGEAHLTAYEHRGGEAPRPVRPHHYRAILNGLTNDLPCADSLATLPDDHFVWSDELAIAFSSFIDDCPGRLDAAAYGMGLEWHPPLLDMAGVVEACVDLSALTTDVRATDANPDPTPCERGKQQTAARNKRLKQDVEQNVSE